MTDGWLQSPEWAANVRAIVHSTSSCPSVHMRPSRSSSLTALCASTARAARGLARWLVLLLLVFDQFSAPWHTHHHDSGVDGTALAAVHADGLQSEVFAQTHAEAPDHRSTWVHVTTVLRSEVGHSLTRQNELMKGGSSLLEEINMPPKWPPSSNHGCNHYDQPNRARSERRKA